MVYKSRSYPSTIDTEGNSGGGREIVTIRFGDEFASVATITGGDLLRTGMNRVGRAFGGDDD